MDFPYPNPRTKISTDTISRGIYPSQPLHGDGVLRKVNRVRATIKQFEDEHEKKYPNSNLPVKNTFTAMASHPGRAWCKYCAGGSKRRGKEIPGYKIEAVANLFSHFDNKAHRDNVDAYRNKRRLQQLWQELAHQQQQTIQQQANNEIIVID